MLSKNDVIAALQKCTGYDSAHTPQPSELVVMAWTEHFQQFPLLKRDDLLEAVKVYHRTTHDRLITPADLSRVARDLRRDRFEHDEELRAEFEALCDSKAAPDEDLPALPPADPEEGRRLARRYNGPGGVERLAADIAKGPSDAVAGDDYLQKLAREQRKAAPPVELTDEEEDK